MYFYRCTEQQLGDALERIHESGDRLHSAVYKGGRDWVLICFKGVSAPPLASTRWEHNGPGERVIGGGA